MDWNDVDVMVKDMAHDTAIDLPPLLPSLGNRTVNTPFLKLASALSMLTLRGSGIARRKAP
jgi:hypothetical protein